MTRSRMFLLAAGLAGAVALAGCGGSDETSAPAESPPATTAAPATEPATTAETQTTGTESNETATTTETEDKPDVDVVIKVVDGERVGGKGRVEAKHGDHVRIEVDVDAPQELHLHGYDIEQEATPDKPGIFEFEAELEGIFELESHASEKVLADVVVSP